MEHPGIVPVYGLGQYADGRPFYAMRFIKGDSLQDAIRRFHRAEGPRRDPGERTLGLRELLGRFVDVCYAVAYAHSRGVLHRDLKPGNVLLGQYRETLVVDWGLAKPVGRLDKEGDSAERTLRPASADGPAPTQVGRSLGTPQYMSPEQAAGRLDQLGPATDVYSLGATLYCLLTGAAPFQREDVGALLGQVQRGDFRSPRRANSLGWQSECLFFIKKPTYQRTFWKVPDPTQSAAPSLHEVDAVVAAPVLDRNGAVIGALYGDRRPEGGSAPTCPVMELEAMLVEVLARGVAAGLARLEQEQAALAARVQFEQFFTPELARQLAQQPDLLTGRDAEVTVLFGDIRGFSRISEHVTVHGSRVTRVEVCARRGSGVGRTWPP